MADEPQENAEEQTEEGEGSSSKGGTVKLLGGVVGVIALGAVAAFMALPKKVAIPRFTGPFSYNIISEEEKISANTKDTRRYLQMVVHAEYYAYKNNYVDVRVTDELYRPKLYSEITRLISRKNLDEVLDGTARESFEAELKSILAPIVFPVHIGNTKLPHDACPDSGIRPGASYSKADFRGRYHDNILKVDALEKTLQLNEGDVVSFEGGEEDLAVPAGDGETVYVDLTELKPDFQGEIEIGVRGKIRRINLPHLIAQ